MSWSSEWNREVPVIYEREGLPLVAVKLSIIVNDGEFPTPVDAIQIGDLAVHKNLKNDKFWQVTHVPTLTRFNAVPFGLHKHTDLVTWCQKVQMELKGDWKELARLDENSYKERNASKDQIMHLCEGTPVGDDGEWK